ncbi:SCP-like extracellular [Sphingomonas piscis]|uniref:SCP-like extracellular n=1 Tax=Sphingomonas piscis TaxID=2714943 RepID=A0A6G7YQS5_9SPHN|nr:CAP domain-containing protein [Sphingomonas piscis]QIK79095.1 SCP-like extracellular [Sphingomonas piscis]
MFSRRLVWVLALIGSCLLDPRSAAATNNLEVHDVNSRLLAAQNREREAAGVPPLQWSNDLALEAEAWADELSRSGEFRHADQTVHGENLWAGSSGAFTPERMIEGWVREKAVYRPGRFPENSTTGNFADVGHYTQLMWRRTRHVGCAVKQGRREDILVCRYAQAGNVVGEVPY